MTDQEFFDAHLAPPKMTPDTTPEERVAAETAEIARLEALDVSGQSSQVDLWRRVAIRDAYWRRRMATRTPEEVARGIIAPG